jgi:hypothetical protein
MTASLMESVCARALLQRNGAKSEAAEKKRKKKNGKKHCSGNGDGSCDERRSAPSVLLLFVLVVAAFLYSFMLTSAEHGTWARMCWEMIAEQRALARISP